MLERKAYCKGTIGKRLHRVITDAVLTLGQSHRILSSQHTQMSDWVSLLSLIKYPLGNKALEKKEERHQSLTTHSTDLVSRPAYELPGLR